MSLEIESKPAVEAARPAGASVPAPKAVQLPRRWPMVVIGIDKLAKGIGLVLLGIGLHFFLSEPRRQQVIDFVNNVRLEPRNMYVTWALEKILAVKVRWLGLFRIGCFVYAALYFVEGFGVLLEKEWAEWVIVVSTSLFLPLELFEIYKEHTWGRILLFLANVGIMVYLCFRIRTQNRVKKAKKLGLEVKAPPRLKIGHK